MDRIISAFCNEGMANVTSLHYRMNIHDSTHLAAYPSLPQSFGSSCPVDSQARDLSRQNMLKMDCKYIVLRAPIVGRIPVLCLDSC